MRQKLSQRERCWYRHSVAFFYLHLIQKGITASTLVCWSMISLTHTPYPVTGMAWSIEESDSVFSFASGSLLTFLRLSLFSADGLLFPALVEEKKDVMDFWSPLFSYTVVFSFSLLPRFLLLLLIPEVLPVKGGESPLHGNFRRFCLYHSRSAERIAFASSFVKLW